VTGVALACVALTWRFTLGTPRCAVCDHSCLPVFLSSAMTRHSCTVTSLDGSMPPSLGLYCDVAALLIAVVRNTRSPHTTGLECPTPGIAVFHNTP
jgi:hypothetical protein